VPVAGVAAGAAMGGVALIVIVVAIVVFQRQQQQKQRLGTSAAAVHPLKPAKTATAGPRAFTQKKETNTQQQSSNPYYNAEKPLTPYYSTPFGETNMYAAATAAYATQRPSVSTSETSVYAALANQPVISSSTEYSVFANTWAATAIWGAGPQPQQYEQQLTAAPTELAVLSHNKAGSLEEDVMFLVPTDEGPVYEKFRTEDPDEPRGFEDEDLPPSTPPSTPTPFSYDNHRLFLMTNDSVTQRKASNRTVRGRSFHEVEAAAAVGEFVNPLFNPGLDV
jgi:hypothetical protein